MNIFSNLLILFLITLSVAIIVKLVSCKIQLYFKYRKERELVAYKRQRNIDRKILRSDTCAYLFHNIDVVTITEILKKYRFLSDEGRFYNFLKSDCVIRIIKDSYLTPIEASDIQNYENNELYVTELDFKKWLTKYEQLNESCYD